MSVDGTVTLLMGITGLCGFVPLNDGTPYTAAVCVDAEDIDGVHTHEKDHYAGILVHEDYYADSSGFNESEIKEEGYYKFLDTGGYRLGFLEPSATPLEVGRCQEVCRCPRDIWEELCFNYVTPMQSVLNRNVRGQLTSWPDLVSSLFEIRGGFLVSGAMSRTAAGAPVVWEIQRGMGSREYRRAMAESAVLFWEVEDVDTVTICLRPLPDQSSTGCRKTIVLRPDGENKIWLEFKNQPRDEWFPGKHEYYDVGDENEHFPHLNRLLAGDLFRSVPEVVEICPAADCPGEAPLRPLIPERARDAVINFNKVTASNPHCPGADYGP